MFSNDYKSAVRKATAVCEAVADGDFEARVIGISEKGDAARLLHAVNRLIDRSDAYVRESRASLEYVAANKYFRRISETGMPGSFGEATRTLNEAMEAMKEKGESFVGVVNGFEEEMKGVVDAVANSASNLEVAAQTMETATTAASSQSTTVVSAAEQASSNVNSVAAATEQLTNSVAEINKQVTHSSQITSEAVDLVQQTNRDITGLSEASEKIGEVVSLISEIANQTNLLALNATIEAARAGEAGKGFAVVASEVKALASQTGKATGDISAQISDIQAASNTAVTSIKNIGDTVANVNEIAATIAAAVEEQSAATSEIARNIDHASSGTNEVSSNIHEINAAIHETSTAGGQVSIASRELSEKGEMLRTGVAEFLKEARRVI